MVPIVLEGPADQTVLVSQTVTFRCVVDGSPKPRIIWRHNGSKLNTAPNVQFMNDRQTLVIHNTRLSHSGEYKCIGRNYFPIPQKDNAKAYLTVIGR